MVTQVRLNEVIDRNTRVVFAFGGHPMAPAEDQHPVTTAAPSTNKVRIIMDELLRGNNLEEIACRGEIDVVDLRPDRFDKVPVGATPDDIARCAVSQDVLAVRCPASNPRSLCICKNAMGCKVDGATTVVAHGAPVGVLDNDQDGAADSTRFTEGAVRIVCTGSGGDGSVDVALDLDRSYWNPSGNQQVPAMGGFDALGPAIVLQTAGALPTGAGCGLVFAPEVVDKDGNRVCAPEDGELANGCAPGDTSAIQFTVDVLRYELGSANPGANRTANVVIQSNVPLDADSVAGITVTENADTVYTDFTATLGTGAMASTITIAWTAAGGLAPSTPYKITVPTTVTDSYQRGAPQPFEVAFTSGAQ